jgi:hypothetical protein
MFDLWLAIIAMCLSLWGLVSVIRQGADRKSSMIWNATAAILWIRCVLFGLGIAA